MVDPAGEPIEPVGVMGSYKTAIGVLVKDNIPIKYMYWHKKDSNWVVPSSLMELCWQKLRTCLSFLLDLMKRLQRRGHSLSWATHSSILGAT